MYFELGARAQTRAGRGATFTRAWSEEVFFIGASVGRLDRHACQWSCQINALAAEGTECTYLATCRRSCYFSDGDRVRSIQRVVLEQVESKNGSRGRAKAKTHNISVFVIVVEEKIVPHGHLSDET